VLVDAGGLKDFARWLCLPALPEGAALFIHCLEVVRFSFIAGRRFAFPAYVWGVYIGYGIARVFRWWLP